MAWENPELERLQSLCITQTRQSGLGVGKWEQLPYLTRLDAVDQVGVWVPLTPPSAHDALKEKTERTKTPGQ